MYVKCVLLHMIQRIIILPVVSCVCGRSITLREKRSLKVGLGEYLGLREARRQGSGEECRTSSFMVCTPRQILFGLSNQEE